MSWKAGVVEIELDFKLQTHSEYRKKETRFLQTGHISFHEKVRKQVFRVLVNHRLNTWQLDSPITSCHSWSHRYGTTVKHQMSARENMFSKYQQAVVHHISARILCTVPCMVLFIHAQGGYGQTGRGAQWRWENEQLSCERRLTAWLKPGQCLTPECVKI